MSGVVPIKYSRVSPAERRAKREEYVVAQGGLCYYCRERLAVSPNMDKTIDWSLFPGGIDFLKHRVHLHHCHKTDNTLGAVHAYCNAVLWQYHGE